MMSEEKGAGSFRRTEYLIPALAALLVMLAAVGWYWMLRTRFQDRTGPPPPEPGLKLELPRPAGGR